MLLNNNQNNNHYYLGIDGGGTKTKLCLINEEKEIIKEIIVGPTSIDTVSLETMKNNIINGIKQIELENYPIKSIYMGVGGITCESDEKNVENTLRTINELKEVKIIKAESDVNNALLTMTGYKEGIVVIMGTGSVVYGCHNNNKHRCGGYCYQEGDKGSAYDLGISAMRILSKVMDGRIEEDDFSKELMAVTSCYSYNDVAKYFQNINRTKVASLAKIVTKHEDNPFARKIMDDAIKEIMLMIKTVYNKLEFTNTSLVIVGSLGLSNTYYKYKFIQEFNNLGLNITLKPSMYDASFASALEAYNQINIK